MSAIIGIFAGASIATVRTELYLIMIERSGSVASPTTRRSTKNIVFNLAQRVSGAYMRFHNDVCLRCDGACARVAGSTTPRRLPPFPRQFDKLVRENFTRQRRKREKERERERAYIIPARMRAHDGFTSYLPAASDSSSVQITVWREKRSSADFDEVLVRL